ncbi:MarR family winged helix-turn-helix transcriptional regulator [Mesorhizobium sp. INR15]|uniref:MarR family winged helix-turn-helix transcriptional regulator n=1 Tax=Mesorhizobium sp. INR15 TaxID=2654248 RepID=UPI0018968600|nr:MarR family winged helix-turn-helix transcriptional regulator [Mesorhizobium sp. INR15]QPC94319.1 MarR family transcriptional regulator [Mesorhizobium sp. INR15]
MSTNMTSPYRDALNPTPPPWESPHDIRDLFSYRLALLTRVNDRQAQNVLVSTYGITLGEWRTLAVVKYLGQPSVRAVARATQQDEGQLSRYVSGLIERGLLVKAVSSEDRRVNDLALTGEGEKLYAEVMEFAWNLNREMFVDLSRDEQQQLVGLLDKLFRALTKE